MGMVLPGGTSALGFPERGEMLRRTIGSDTWAREADELAAWLIGPARLSGDAVAVTSGFAQRLTAMGVPLHRLRIAMRVDNPLLTAWGIIWAPETAAEIFTLSRALLDTPHLCRQPGPACH
jgi:adenylate cyclase